MATQLAVLADQISQTRAHGLRRRERFANRASAHVHFRSLCLVSRHSEEFDLYGRFAYHDDCSRFEIVACGEPGCVSARSSTCISTPVQRTILMITPSDKRFQAIERVNTCHRRKRVYSRQSRNFPCY